MEQQDDAAPAIVAPTELALLSLLRVTPNDLAIALSELVPLPGLPPLSEEAAAWAAAATAAAWAAMLWRLLRRQSHGAGGTSAGGFDTGAEAPLDPVSES